MSITYTVQHTDGRHVRKVTREERIRIGRNPESHIPFEDEGNESVSWDHAEIVLGSQATLEDLGSTNGTFLNSQRIDSAVPLSAGDLIKLGAEGPTLVIHQIADAVSTHDIARSPILTARQQKYPTWIGWTGAACFVFMLALVAAIMLRREPRTLVQSGVPPPDSAAVPNPVPTPVPTSDLGPLPDQDPEATRTPRKSLSADEIRDKYKTAMVWCGVTIFDAANGFEAKFPYCSGWLIDDGKVVVTAERIIDFEKLRTELDAAVFVYHPSTKFADVGRISLHPLYDRKQPVAGRSVLHNVGVSEVEGLRSIAFETSNPHEFQSLSGTRVFVLAYEIFDDEKPRQYDRLSAPKLNVVQGSITRTQTFPNCADFLPLLKARLPSSEPKVRLDGGLVVDEFGAVLGSLTELSDGYFVVPFENMSQLLGPE